MFPVHLFLKFIIDFFFLLWTLFVILSPWFVAYATLDKRMNPDSQVVMFMSWSRRCSPTWRIPPSTTSSRLRGSRWGSICPPPWVEKLAASAPASPPSTACHPGPAAAPPTVPWPCSPSAPTVRKRYVCSLPNTLNFTSFRYPNKPCYWIKCDFVLYRWMMSLTILLAWSQVTTKMFLDLWTQDSKWTTR